MAPLVSILIPAYNAERWIADTIKSAMGQTWQNKEIIIVDDGSIDHTVSVARQFASGKVAVVTQKNQGAAAARNKAFSLSRGDYIQWLDADDLLAEDKISTQMKAADGYHSKRTLLSCAWAHFISRPSKADFVPTGLWRDLAPVEWLLCKWEQNVFLPNSSWLVSRELSEEAGPWDIRLSLDDDGEYFSRVVRLSDFVRFVPEAAAFYRRSGFQSLSNIDPTDKKLDSLYLSMQLQIANTLSLEDSQRVRLACLGVLQRYMVCFYPERPGIVRQLERLAIDLGGCLEVPRLSWKYAWIQKLLGWTAAKRTDRYYNRCKSLVIGFWDSALRCRKI
jgi:glycosyltransferase involved in cell wall biosynthesis